jgi:hypothetical protein
MGRYANWTIKENASAEHKQQYFVPVMEGVRAHGLPREYPSLTPSLAHSC